MRKAHVKAESSTTRQPHGWQFAQNRANEKCVNIKYRKPPNVEVWFLHTAHEAISICIKCQFSPGAFNETFLRWQQLKFLHSDNKISSVNVDDVVSLFLGPFRIWPKKQLLPYTIIISSQPAAETTRETMRVLINFTINFQLFLEEEEKVFALQ